MNSIFLLRMINRVRLHKLLCDLFFDIHTINYIIVDDKKYIKSILPKFDVNPHIKSDVNPHIKLDVNPHIKLDEIIDYVASKPYIYWVYLLLSILETLDVLLPLNNSNITINSISIQRIKTDTIMKFLTYIVKLLHKKLNIKFSIKDNYCPCSNNIIDKVYTIKYDTIPSRGAMHVCYSCAIANINSDINNYRFILQCILRCPSKFDTIKKLCVLEDYIKTKEMLEQYIDGLNSDISMFVDLFDKYCKHKN